MRNGRSSGTAILPRSAFGDTSSETLPHCDNLVGGTKGARSDQHRHSFPRIEHVRGAPQRILARDDSREVDANARTEVDANARTRGAMIARRFDHRSHLKVARQHDARHLPLGLGNPVGTVDEMGNLRRNEGRLDERARDILEKRLQIEVLLVVRADRGARLLSDEGEHGLMVELSVVQSVEEMYGARPDVAMHTPTSPVNFAAPQAISAAISSWRTWTNSMSSSRRAKAPIRPPSARPTQ